MFVCCRKTYLLVFIRSFTYLLINVSPVYRRMCSMYTHTTCKKAEQFSLKRNVCTARAVFTHCDCRQCQRCGETMKTRTRNFFFNPTTTNGSRSIGARGWRTRCRGSGAVAVHRTVLRAMSDNQQQDAGCRHARQLTLAELGCRSGLRDVQPTPAPPHAPTGGKAQVWHC